MNIELFKSILLTLLVVLSGLLTWNVWSYQPNYESLDESTPTVEISIADERTNSELIKPSRFLVHGEEIAHGTANATEINNLLSIMGEWTFFNVRVNTSLNEDQFKEVVHGSNRIEIIFPTQIPFSEYQDIFNFEVNQLPEATFDRIVVQTADRDEETFTVYFVSYDKRIVHEARVDREELSDMRREIVTSAPVEYKGYFEYKAGNRNIYIPQSTSEVIQYKYLMNTIDPFLFRNALFPVPADVNVNEIGSNEVQYLDSTSFMKVDNSTNILNYVNPSAADPAITGSAGELLQKSRRFVNEHKGWTDTYYLYHLDVPDQEVSYRLHVQGLPVFNDRGASHIAQITQQWGEVEIFKYDRSLMTFEVPVQVPSSAETSLIMSGYEAIAALEKKDDFEPELLEDLMIGYHMSKDSTNALYTLEPMWFYLYNGSWQRVPVDGGDPVGLE